MSDRVCQDDCEAYRLFGTPDEFLLNAMKDDLHDMSPGITAWRVIAFAMERGLDLPDWVKAYLEGTAKGIEDWAMLNGHPAELKEILCLHGKRKFDNDHSDPRWIFDGICQMRVQQPDATVKALVRAYMKQFPHAGTDEETVRQKYYQGKRLAETGEDYKARGRKREIGSGPSVEVQPQDDDLNF